MWGIAMPTRQCKRTVGGPVTSSKHLSGVPQTLTRWRVEGSRAPGTLCSMVVRLPTMNATR